MNRCIRLTEINNEAAQFCDSRLQIIGIIIRKALREVARGYVDKPRRAGVLYSLRAITLQKYNPPVRHGRVVFVNLPAVLTLSMKYAVARSRHWFFLSSFLCRTTTAGSKLLHASSFPIHLIATSQFIALDLA